MRVFLQDLLPNWSQTQSTNYFERAWVETDDFMSFLRVVVVVIVVVVVVVALQKGKTSSTKSKCPGLKTKLLPMARLDYWSSGEDEVPHHYS